MNRNGWLLGLLGAMALTFCVSCKGKEAVAELEKVRDQACKCEDQKCADESLDGLSEWMDKHAETQATEDTIKEGEKVITELFECAQKAGASEEKMMEIANQAQSL